MTHIERLSPRRLALAEAAGETVGPASHRGREEHEAHAAVNGEDRLRILHAHEPVEFEPVGEHAAEIGSSRPRTVTGCRVVCWRWCVTWVFPCLSWNARRS
jgi:hypothetical protein